jgi:hypothetical protein
MTDEKIGILDLTTQKSSDSGSDQLWLYLVDQDLARHGLQCRSLFLPLSGGIYA